MQKNDWLEQNRKLWDNRTGLHIISSFYDNEAFIKGKNTLNEIELQVLGDVRGKKILHLQCHFGQDSLSLARMGAHVTGVDFSPQAIETAISMSKKLSAEAQFFCHNIYDLHPSSTEYKEEIAPQSFDIVFASYGTICWLPTLKEWGELIAHYLKPGGFFLLVDTHPLLLVFNDELTHVQYDYDSINPIILESSSTYTGQKFEETLKEYSWNHSLSSIFTSLLNAGLGIELFQEHMQSPYNCYANMVEVLPGKWQIKGMENKIPVLFSLKATKPVNP